MRLLISAPNDFYVSFQSIYEICTLSHFDVTVEKIYFTDDEWNISVKILFRVAALVKQEILEKWEYDILMIMEVYLSNKSRHLFFA
jgi:hypothetical protein